MARARTRFPAGRGGHKRLNEWVGPPEQGFVAVATTGATLVSSLVVEEAITIVRTRGMVSIDPNVFSADLNVVGAFGIGIVSAEAFGIGITAIPTPYSDADWPGWLMWESFAFRLEFSDATGVTMPGSLQINVDSKGMRRIGSNEAVVFVAESQEGAFTIADCTRQLFKLS